MMREPSSGYGRVLPHFNKVALIYNPIWLPKEEVHSRIR